MAQSSLCRRIAIPLVIIAVLLGVLFLILYFTVFAKNASTMVGKWQPDRRLHSFNSCGQSKVIALTFDDGPHLVGTPNVLEALKRHNVKATFFMTPHVEGPPTDQHCQMMKTIMAQGHSVQSHSWDHSNFVGQTGQQVYDNLLQVQQWMDNCLGRKYTGLQMFRPPYGELTPEYANFISKLGYTLASWNVESRDFDGLNADQIFQTVQSKFIPNESTIILMHDKHYIAGGSLGCLDQIIPFFQNQGYEFVTGPDCYGRCKQEVCAPTTPVWPGTWDRVW